MKQLAQLEMRARADTERERWCAAVDRAVTELVTRGGIASRTALKRAGRATARCPGGAASTSLPSAASRLKRVTTQL
jgi:hypothetical protein